MGSTVTPTFRMKRKQIADFAKDPKTIRDVEALQELLTNAVPAALGAKVDETRQIIAGDGLTGTHDLTADVTLNVGPGTGITVTPDAVNLANTAVAPATYGDATHVGQFTADQQGRLTFAQNVAITFPAIQTMLDSISNVRGTILYRGVSAWAGLAPGSAGSVLQTNGVGADPSWGSVPAGSGGSAWKLLTTSGGTPASSTVTITIASPGVVTWTAHGLVAGTAVSFATTGALPTGLTAGTIYYVVSPLTNSFSVAATVGGTAINTTGSQSGTHTAAVGATWTFSTAVASVAVTGLGSFNELLIVGTGIAASASGVRRICASVDGGSNWFTSGYTSVTTSGVEGASGGWSHSTSTTSSVGVVVHIMNTKGPMKIGTQNAASPFVYFTATALDINAIRLDNNGAGNLTSGSMLVYGR